MNNTNEQSKPWYKYWAVWLIIVLPLTAIVASGVTVYIAIIYHQAPADKSYYKEGFTQKEITIYSDKAKQMKLEATLLIDGNIGEVTFNQKLNDKSLDIKFQHPILEKKDFKIKALELSGNTYSFVFPKVDIKANDWVIFINSDKNKWQLKSRLKKGIKTLLLKSTN